MCLWRIRHVRRICSMLCCAAATFNSDCAAYKLQFVGQPDCCKDSCNADNGAECCTPKLEISMRRVVSGRLALTFGHVILASLEQLRIGAARIRGQDANFGFIFWHDRILLSHLSEVCVLQDVQSEAGWYVGALQGAI